MSELNYGLSEMALEIREMVREFAVTRVKPVRAELDETGEFPTDLLQELGKMDLMGLYIPEEYGGTFDGDSMPEHHCDGGTEPDLHRCFGFVRGERAGRRSDPARRQRRAEEEVSAPAGQRREVGGLRLDRAQRGFRCGLDSHDGGQEGRQVHPERHEAVDHQRRRSRYLYDLCGDGQEPRGRAACAASSSKRTCRDSTSGRKRTSWAFGAARRAS